MINTNKRKNILIITHFFFPTNSPRSHRATELTKEFARQGHNVTVFVPNLTKEQSRFAYKHNFAIRNLGKLKWKLPNFGKSKIGYIISRAILRLLQLSIEYPNIELMFKVIKALKKEKGYDLLISISVPYTIHWGVAKARKNDHKIAKVWIADCGDPYMGGKTDSFKKWFYFKYVEKWFMRKTDIVSIPVESARGAYYNEFQSKIRIIPQGFKITPLKPKMNHRNNIISFAYAGSFIPEIRDPRKFLNYLSKINRKFRFFIFTNNAGLVNDFKKELGDRLEIKSYIPRQELLHFLSTMDFVVNFDNNTETAVPSKLIDYKIVDKPILNIKNELDTNLIYEFLDRNYTNAMKIDNIDNYRIESVCNQFLKATAEYE